MNRPIMLRFLLILASLFAVSSAAIAQDDPTATPEPEATAEMMEGDTATYLRFAHFAPGVDGADVFLNDSAVQESNLTYPGVTGWMAIDPGTYSVDVAPVGGSTADAVVTANDIQIGPGFVTFAVIQGEDDTVTSFAVRENRGDLVPGTSGLTLMNGLSTNTPVNFDRDGVPFVTELSQSSNRALYTPVDSGTYTFRAYNPFAEGGGTYGEETEIELVDGSYYLIAVVGTPNDAQLLIHETTGAEFAMVSGELEEPGTLVEAVRSHDSLAAYADIFSTANLTETLSGEGPYTVLLPADYLTDEIHAAVGSDSETLANTLRDHVIEGDVPMGQLTDLDSVTTLAGNTYDVTIQGNTVLIGDMEVLTANIHATNGVIHVIDGILGMTEIQGESG